MSEQSFFLSSKDGAALMSFFPGDHVKRFCFDGAFFHHGIVKLVDIDKKRLTIIHFMASTDQSMKAQIGSSEEKMSEFQLVYRTDNPHTVLGRANACTYNYPAYNLLFENCEHFANYCVTGEKHSLQVVNVSIMVGSALTRTVVGPMVPLMVQIAPAAFEAIKSYFVGNMSAEHCAKRLVQIASSKAVKVGFAASFGTAVGIAAGTAAFGPMWGIACGAFAGYAAAHAAHKYLRENLLYQDRDQALDDAYDTLGLARGCSINDVNAAYRSLCLTHHPDKGGDAEKMLAINTAVGLIRLQFEAAEERERIKKLREDAQKLSWEIEQKLLSNLKDQEKKLNLQRDRAVKWEEHEREITRSLWHLLDDMDAVNQITTELKDLKLRRYNEESKSKEAERCVSNATTALEHAKCCVNLMEDFLEKAREKLKHADAEMSAMKFRSQVEKWSARKVRRQSHSLQKKLTDASELVNRGKMDYKKALSKRNREERKADEAQKVLTDALRMNADDEIKDCEKNWKLHSRRYERLREKSSVSNTRESE